jgi:hypothetical protein
MPIPMKNSGPPVQLLDTVAPSGKAPQRGGIPPQFESTIRAAESEALDGETAGSEGLSGNLQPLSNGALDKALPGFSSLIPASDIHVP